MVNERKGDWFQTRSGIPFYILDPRPEDVVVEDIAHSLAYQCRYNGHSARFYSVAEHAWHVSQVADQQGRPSVDIFHALHHDSAEAYTSDIPKPIKNSLPDLREAEDRVEAVVFAALGVPCAKPQWLRELDQRIVKDEKEQLMGPPRTGAEWPINGDKQKTYDALEPLGVKVQCWSPGMAKEMFLRGHYQLLEAIHGN